MSVNYRIFAAASLETLLQCVRDAGYPCDPDSGSQHGGLVLYVGWTEDDELDVPSAVGVRARTAIDVQVLRAGTWEDVIALFLGLAGYVMGDLVLSYQSETPVAVRHAGRWMLARRMVEEGALDVETVARLGSRVELMDFPQI